MIEIPAGKIDPARGSPRDRQRELKEETGYAAAQWRHLATIHIAIAYSSERIEIYLAKGLRQEGSKLDDEEFLEVFTLPLATALAWFRGASRERSTPRRGPSPPEQASDTVFESCLPLAHPGERGGERQGEDLQEFLVVELRALLPQAFGEVDFDALARIRDRDVDRRQVAATARRRSPSPPSTRVGRSRGDPLPDRSCPPEFRSCRARADSDTGVSITSSPASVSAITATAPGCSMNSRSAFHPSGRRTVSLRTLRSFPS